MGLGPYPSVSLADARKRRDEAEAMVRAEIDPIAARESRRKAEAGKPTFGEAAGALIAAKASAWRSEKHHRQWVTTLETYAAPLWNTPIDEIDTAAVF